MSSAVLYAAIVAVWGIVLVPMWIRRDGEGIGRLLHRRNDTVPVGTSDHEAAHTRDDGVVADPADSASDPEHGSDEYGELVRRRRVTRGAVIARRRRRTLGLSLLTLTAVVVSALQVAPWWFVLPPVLLLGGHLSLLRVAVRIDQVRRAELRRAAARAEHLRRAREEREAQAATEADDAARTAEVIELPGRHEDVYDQYTDLRAVGD